MISPPPPVRRRPVVPVARGPDRERALILAHPFAALLSFWHPSQHEIASRELIRVGPGHRGPAPARRGPCCTVRPSWPERRPGRPRIPRPVLLTTFNGPILARITPRPLDLLNPRLPSVRDRNLGSQLDAAVLSACVSRPAARRSSPTSGSCEFAGASPPRTPACDLTPSFAGTVEACHLAQDLRPIGPPDRLRTRPGRPADQGPSPPVLACLPASRPTLAQPVSPPTSSGPTKATQLLRQPGSAALPAHPGGRGPGLSPAAWPAARAASIPAPTTCSFAGPTRTQRIYCNFPPSPASGHRPGRSRRLSLNYVPPRVEILPSLPLLAPTPLTALTARRTHCSAPLAIHGPPSQAWQAPA